MRIGIRITPNASKDQIAGRTRDGRFRIKVQSPPVEGKANRRLLEFIARTVGVSKSRVKIVSGVKSRDKIVEIDGDKEEIMLRLEKVK